MNGKRDTSKTLPRVRHLEACIRRMAAAARRASAGPSADRKGLGWWVLACGEPYRTADLADRDCLRDRLRAEVEGVGILLPEWIWVWDEENRAQLVITTLPSRERAERVAERLRGKGLTMRVVRERF